MKAKEIGNDKFVNKRLRIYKRCGYITSPTKVSISIKRRWIMSRIKTFAVLAMVSAVVGLFSLPELTLANGNCKSMNGNLSVVNNLDGTTSGTITQGGKLNGITKAIFNSAPVPSGKGISVGTVTHNLDILMCIIK